MVKILSSLAILLLFLASLFVVNRLGVSSRVYGKVHGIAENRLPVRIVKRTADVYATWKGEGVRNRIIVNLGRYLHFVELDSNQGFRTARHFPLRAESTRAEYEARISYLNFLWAAIETDIAREVYNVLPPAAFQRKVGEIAQAEGVWRRSGDVYVAQYYGSLRVLASRIPREREPVLLNIDASFLESADLERVVRELRGAGLVVDVVTLCLSEDSPDVTAQERSRLLDLARMLAG